MMKTPAVNKFATNLKIFVALQAKAIQYGMHYQSYEFEVFTFPNKVHTVSFIE